MRSIDHCIDVCRLRGESGGYAEQRHSADRALGNRAPGSIGLRRQTRLLAFRRARFRRANFVTERQRSSWAAWPAMQFLPVANR